MPNIGKVHMTPGQRCLLDLLQRRLLNNIQSYAKLNQEKIDSGCKSEGVDLELLRLKDKIKRISARQKRFTLEIISGNGNNTIPKESFFQALGLVTKEALNKLNSKSNERRRRTTANPRFSHEAIQAKRALEPLHRRYDSRVSKEKKDTPKRPNNERSGFNNRNKTQPRTNLSASKASSRNDKKVTNPEAQKDSTESVVLTRTEENDGLFTTIFDKFREYQREVDRKRRLIRGRRESNDKLSKENELIRQKGLDLINLLNSALSCGSQSSKNGTQEALSEGNRLKGSSINDDPPKAATDQQQQTDQNRLDIWIDMKCEESLDGLD